MPAPSEPDPQALLAKLTARGPAMLDDLDALVSAESPSSDPEALLGCRALLADVGTRLLGEAPEVLPGDEGTGTPGGLLWRLGDADRAPVLLVGHLDTVWPLGHAAATAVRGARLACGGPRRLRHEGGARPGAARARRTA